MAEPVISQNDLDDYVRYVCAELDIAPSNLASLAKVSQPTLTRGLNPDHKDKITLKTVLKIQEATGIPFRGLAHDAAIISTLPPKETDKRSVTGAIYLLIQLFGNQEILKLATDDNLEIIGNDVVESLKQSREIKTVRQYLNRLHQLLAVALTRTLLSHEEPLDLRREPQLMQASMDLAVLIYHQSLRHE